MELDDLEENIENQVKIEAKAEKSKKDDWKQNFFDINTMSDYIKANGHKDLQRFTIIEKIGKGSESLVYKVRVNNTNNVFALKVIKKHKNKINLNELILCRKLKHKNIINTLCYYADPNKQLDYMIMEIGNSNLMNFARKILKRFTLSETFLCMAAFQSLTLSETFLCMAAFQSLQGLAYLHRLNIAHLDIKPQNLIINDYLEIKIIDFSVSMDYSRNAKEFKLPYVGTPFFMAPEIIKSEKVKRKDMQKIDLFSLGVIFFRCYTICTRFW